MQSCGISTRMRYVHLLTDSIERNVRSNNRTRSIFTPFNGAYLYYFFKIQFVVGNAASSFVIFFFSLENDALRRRHYHVHKER